MVPRPGNDDIACKGSSGGFETAQYQLEDQEEEGGDSVTALLVEARYRLTNFDLTTCE
jgi:hypothetical protein